MVVHERKFDEDKHSWVVKKTEIPVHRCNDYDYEKLYPIDERGSRQYEILMKRGAFLCPNETDINGTALMPKLFGQDKLGEYRALEIRVDRNSSDHRDYSNTEFLMVSNRELPQLKDRRKNMINRESVIWHKKL